LKETKNFNVKYAKKLSIPNKNLEDIRLALIPMHRVKEQKERENESTLINLRLMRKLKI